MIFLKILGVFGHPIIAFWIMHFHIMSVWPRIMESIMPKCIIINELENSQFKNHHWMSFLDSDSHFHTQPSPKSILHMSSNQIYKLLQILISPKNL